MAVIEFSEYFWGEKNEGFSILYQNMKCGVIAAKELSEYLREMAKIQEDSSKAHLKMVKQLNTSGPCGTVSPVLQSFKAATEKFAAIHNLWMIKLTDLMKDVNRYSDDLHRTHKKVKEDESPTSDAVKNIQDTTAMLQKSKENYKQRCLEVEKLRREGASTKELEKSEVKFRKAQEEYKSLVEKYCGVRDEFEKKMTMAAKHFQQIEVEHLGKMREFVEMYCKIVDDNNNQWGRAHQEFQIQLAGLTVANLMETFAMAKYTGLEKPGRWAEFAYESSLRHSPVRSNGEAVSRDGSEDPNNQPSSSTKSKRRLSTGSALASLARSNAKQSRKSRRRLSVAETCPIEFEEEKISVNSQTGPPSDISDRSGSNSDKLSLGGNSIGGGSTPSASAMAAGASASAAPSAGAGAPMTPASSSTTPTGAGVLRKESNSGGGAGPRKAFSPSPSPIPTPAAVEEAAELSSRSQAKRASISVEGDVGDNEPDSLREAAPETVSESPVAPTPPPNSIASDAVKSDSAADEVATSTPEPAAVVAEDSVTVQVNEPSPVADEGHSPVRSPYTIAGFTGFLRRRQKKEKKKKSGDDDGGDSQKEMGSEGEDIRKSGTPTPDVDDEGFSKQPDTTGSSDPWSDFNHPSKSFYSSSDESDDDTKKKIKVEIKPLSNGDGSGTGGAAGSSVDELQRAVGGLELVPPPLSRFRPQSALNDRIGSGTQTLRVKAMPTMINEGNKIRRSQSQSVVNKPSQDLLGLTLHPIDTGEGTGIQNTNTQKSDGAVGGLDISQTSSGTSKEITDILGEFGDGIAQPKLPPKLGAPLTSAAAVGSTPPGPPAPQRPSSVQREKIANNLIALPRPPSRHGSVITSGHATISGRIRTTPSPIPASLLGDNKLSLARQDSSELSPRGAALAGTLPRPKRSSSSSPSREDKSAAINPALNATPPRFGTSRGPSPLTLGMGDVIPIAVAFQEVCHACFRGADENQCQVRLIGDMMISFPAGIVQVFMSNPNPAPLLFRIKNSSVLETILPNKQLIHSVPTLSTNEMAVYEFNMASLKELMRKQSEQNPNASYFNIDILKYQVKARQGAASCPLQMVAYWKCANDNTDLRLDYKYNAHAMAEPSALLNLSIAVPIDGGVKNMQSKPNGKWIAQSNRALWHFQTLSQAVDNGVGSLRARFELTDGPGSQGTIAAQFNCEGTTLSGVEFQLVGAGYRLSLVKKRFVSGKYVCDNDASADGGGNRYAAPPSPFPVPVPGSAALSTTTEAEEV